MHLGNRVFTRSKIQTDEGDVSYVVSRGPGPSLLLMPGSFGDCRVFDEVIAFLPSELQIVIAEIRGHGGSWPPPANGSIEQFAADTMSVADAAGLDAFYVGGHSIGGMVSLEIGRRWPRRTSGIISVEGWTRSQAAEAFQGSMENTLTDEQVRKKRSNRERVTRKWTQQQVEEFARIWKRWDGLKFLRTTRTPILEMWGDRGRPRPALKRLYIPRRKNIQVHWVSGASHSLLLERPGEVAKAIAAFISELERPRSRDREGPGR